MKRFIVILLSAICLTSCDWFDHGDKERQVILMYVAADNNLSSWAVESVDSLKSGYLPLSSDRHNVMLVFYHGANGTPTLSRYSKTKKGLFEEEIIKSYPQYTNSATAETLSEVLADAEMAYPADRRGLFLWSHATGFLPEGYYTNPLDKAAYGDEPVFDWSADRDPYADIVKSGADISKSFGYQDDREIEIGDLRKALVPYHYDFIIFDCCLMAGIEVAFELRHLTDYMVFSPTEILAQSIPYEKVMEQLFNSNNIESAVKNVCQQYMNFYFSLSGDLQSATISMVRTSALDELASVCKPIFANHRSEIYSIDRSSVQEYFRYDCHWFYDFDDLVVHVASPEEYSKFSAALAKAVIYKSTTPRFLEIEINHYSGLSIYIPRTEYTNLNNYYKGLLWNIATGYVQ